MLQYLLFSFGIILLLFFLTAAIISINENEKRAAGLFLLIGILITIPFFLSHLFTFLWGISLLLGGLFIAMLLFFIIPIKGYQPAKAGTPGKKIDERTTMFSRNELQPGTKLYDEYYKKNPDHLTPDTKFRKEPGLLSLQSKYANLFCFASAEASFSTVGYLDAGVKGKVSPVNQTLNPETTTEYIKSWSNKLGAVNTGITKLQEYHLYSTGGRRERYGKNIEKNHRFAIAFTVEMDFNMMATSPYAPTVMESAEQYLNAGTIAVQIAHFIRNLGYDARAHIDGNYELNCPLVAKDAGLGEIGRIGLLMTPAHGPRVRVAVVTTNIPLLIDKKFDDPSILDFCNQCRKCADVCPTQAIPKTGRKTIAGAKRWQINSEKCFTYWCQSGTDCGKCVISCPYSHPDNLLHKVVRTGIKRNFFFRRLAIKLDDLFYGKIPGSKSFPNWVPQIEKEDH